MTRSDLTHTAATAALELLPDGVLVVCDGEVVLANRALARLTGEDLTGRPAPDWLPSNGSGEVVVRGRPRFVIVAPCEIGSVVTVRESAAPSVLAHRASHDGLTGLLNQRAFREHLAAESERCAADGRPLSVIVVDLDHFKAINDVHGHPTGDRVLAEAAARIAGAARAVDTVGRIGGEEFAWLLPDDSAESALIAAQRLRAAINETQFAGGLRVTASMGICDLSTARNPESLLARADEALYWSKAFGRDAALVWSARTAGRLARGRAGGLDALAGIAAPSEEGPALAPARRAAPRHATPARPARAPARIAAPSRATPACPADAPAGTAAPSRATPARPAGAPARVAAPSRATPACPADAPAGTAAPSRATPARPAGAPARVAAPSRATPARPAGAPARIAAPSHGGRVAELAVALAEALGWDPARQARLHQAARLHDVGKAALPDQLLSRPGPLSGPEVEHVRQHASVGAGLAAALLDPEQCDWIRHHHERWDGAGYPAALAAGAIPDGAQLLALADAWDTMTSGRPYRAALTPENALAEIDHVAGTHLRPDAGTLLRTARAWLAQT